MGFQLSPSVDVREIDLTNVVPAVSTSIGGMAGSFEWGPCEQIVTISNEKNLRATFGDPRISTSLSAFNNQIDWYTCANFLSYTSNLKIVRAYSELHKNASEQKTLVGNYRSDATFTPARYDESEYTIDFGDSFVTGTNPEGSYQQTDLTFRLSNPNVSNVTAGAPQSGVRKRYAMIVNTPANENAIVVQDAGVRQKEMITVGGNVSAAGTITMTFGNTVISVDVSNGETSELVAIKISNAISASGIALAPQQVDNTVTFEYVNATGTEADGTGIDDQTGFVRKTQIDSTVPGLTVSSEVLTIGRNGDQFYTLVYDDPSVEAQYLLITNDDTKTTIATNLGRVVENLSFSYKGGDEPIETIGNSVTWTNVIYGAAPSKDITAIDGGSTNVTFDISTNPAQGGREGEDPTPATAFTIRITGYPTGSTVDVTIPGGSSIQKVAALVNEQLLITPSAYNVEGLSWSTQIPQGAPETVRFIAPIKTSTDVIPLVQVFDDQNNLVVDLANVFYVEFGNDDHLLDDSTISGTPKYGATMVVNDVVVPITEGDSSATVAGSYAYVVNNYVRPEMTETNVAYSIADSTTGGSGALFNVTSEAGVYTNVEYVDDSGDDSYTIGDELVIKGAQLDGLDGTHDLPITVTGVGGDVDDLTGVTGPSDGSGDLQNTTQALPAAWDPLVGFPTFNFTSDGNNGYNVTSANGSNYSPTDTITVLGSVFGGTDGVNDAVVSVATVEQSKSILNKAVPGTLGTPAVISFERDAGIYTPSSVSVLSAGSGYSVGTYTILGTDVEDGATIANNVTVNVTSISDNLPTVVAAADVIDTRTYGDGNAEFEVEFDGGYSDINIVSQGAGYEANDLVTVLGSDLHGVDGANDLMIQIDAVDSDKTDLGGIPSLNGSATPDVEITVDTSGNSYTNPQITKNDERIYAVGDVARLSTSVLYGATNNHVEDVTVTSATTFTTTGSYQFIGMNDSANFTHDGGLEDDMQFVVNFTTGGGTAGITSVTFISDGHAVNNGDTITITEAQWNAVGVTTSGGGDTVLTLIVDDEYYDAEVTIASVDGFDIDLTDVGAGGSTRNADGTSFTPTTFGNINIAVDGISRAYTATVNSGGEGSGWTNGDRIFIKGDVIDTVNGNDAGNNDLLLTVVTDGSGGLATLVVTSNDEYSDIVAPLVGGEGTGGVAGDLDENDFANVSATGTGVQMTLTLDGLGDLSTSLDATGAGYTVGDYFEFNLSDFGGTLATSTDIIRVTVTGETAGAIDTIETGIIREAVAPIADARGLISTNGLNSIVVGNTWNFGAITAASVYTGTATTEGGIATATVSGTALTTGPILTAAVTTQPNVSSGFIVDFTPDPAAVANDGKPASTVVDGAIVTVVTTGVEDISGPAPSETTTEYGITYEIRPSIDTPAGFDIPFPTMFVTDGDVTEYLTKQLGDQNNPSYALNAIDVTLTGDIMENGEIVEEDVQVIGKVLSWEYDSEDDVTDVEIQHDGGTRFVMGLPPYDEYDQVEPDPVKGEKIFVDVTEVIKNNEDFEVKRTSLDGGYFYAIYPGAKGNNIGIGFVDACMSESAYDGSTFGDGTSFSDVFDARPSTSDYAIQKASGTNDEIHVVVYDATGSLSGTKGAVLESYPFLSKNPTATDNTGQTIYYVDAVNASSDYVRIIEGWVGSEDFRVDLTADLDWGDEAMPNAEETYGVMNYGASFQLGGGVDAAPNDGEIIQAYSLLSDAETVDISLLLSSNHSKTVKKNIIDISESRRDVVCFLSPDYNSAVNSADATSIVNYFNNSTDGFISTSYAVFDSGFKYQYDRYNNSYFWCPLNSDIAGLCARTDDTNDPWWSPAGLTRGQIKNVVRLSFNPDKTDRDELYKNRINPVASFTGAGTMLYGDKTAQAKPSSFQQINVRRLFITLEKAIATMARAYLFEFNDSFTRADFVSKVTPFLRDVQSRRGVEGFVVVCDTTNNTPQVINSNSFVGDIYIKPNRSINFITLNFVSVNSGVEFSEVINPTDN